MTIPIHRKILIGAVVLLVLAFSALLLTMPAGDTAISQSETQTPVSQSVATPELTFQYGGVIALALTPEQVLVKRYIPPCDAGFDYCLYYIGHTYDGTNFESAGVRITKRPDLATRDTCLLTPPNGFLGIVPQMSEQKDYTTSVFAPTGDAGAGHTASGALYRLFVHTTCYEFETRIGQTQFANYDSGTIREFTEHDGQTMTLLLQSILSQITITEGNTPVIFPGVL